MSRRSSRKRDLWFKRGVEALQKALPDTPSVYCCPLCLQGFDDPQDLSFEDVPPQSVGGKPLLLTCTKCNNTHGRDLDSHIKSGRDLGDVLAGKSTTWARLRLGDIEVTTKALLGSENVDVSEVVGKSHPAMSEAFASQFQELVASGSRDWQLELQFSARHDPWREDLAWLRVAYLFLFALLGYSYILRPELAPIRAQFASPDEHLVPQVLKRMTDSIGGDQIVVVSRPAHLRGFAVRLSARMLLLPGFVETEGFYERLDDMPAKGRLAMTGKSLQFPQRPVFVCDYHPESIGYLVPPQLTDEDPGG